MNKFAYGWKADNPDQRDFAFRSSFRPKLMKLPDRVDMRAKLPPCWDQSVLGSCTGHGTVGAMMFGRPDMPMLSRLMAYYNGRYFENLATEDSGCQIRDVVKMAAMHGVCREDLMPYDIAKFADHPSDDAWTDGLAHVVKAYARLEPAGDPSVLLDCLANGEPFVFGFTVYSSFESDAVTANGVMPMPSKAESVLGGHCVLCVGYDLPSGRFICRNSWGPAWGDKGHFTMPLEYIINDDLATDFWHVSTVGYGPALTT